MSTQILLIDDDKDYSTQLQAEGKKLDFDILIADNLESGMAKLRSKSRIQALILDGRCALTADKSEPVRSNFVMHALQQLRDIEDDYNRIIPFCVNTETPDDFTEELAGIASVFRKGKDHEAMFSHLHDLINALPRTIIREEYGAIFEKIKGRFDNESEDLLADVLKAMETSDKATITTHLGMLRLLLEALIDEVCQEKLGRAPESFKFGEGSRTRRIIDAMRQHVLPIELYDSAIALYRICSRYGNHQDPVTPGAIILNPGKYTYQRMVFSLLELIDYLVD